MPQKTIVVFYSSRVVSVRLHSFNALVRTMSTTLVLVLYHSKWTFPTEVATQTKWKPSEEFHSAPFIITAASLSTWTSSAHLVDVMRCLHPLHGFTAAEAIACDVLSMAKDLMRLWSTGNCNRFGTDDEDDSTAWLVPCHQSKINAVKSD